ncbi:MAG TPA: hypothetical protein VGO39_08590 [Gaiellaceae bacterium]|jgi:hypothetical protein|nr:hypothetical protein [Gaiellaceae bacterium]
MTAFWICAGVTALSAFVSLGYAVAAVVSPGEARTNAMYALSRSVALAVVSLVPLVSQTRSSLLTIALGMVIVQALDAVVGATLHDPMKTFGPASLGLVNLVALVWFLV